MTDTPPLTKAELVTALTRRGWRHTMSSADGSYEVWTGQCPDHAAYIPTREQAPDYQWCLRRAAHEFRTCEREHVTIEQWVRQVGDTEYAREILIEEPVWEHYRGGYEITMHGDIDYNIAQETWEEVWYDDPQRVPTAPGIPPEYQRLVRRRVTVPEVVSDDTDITS